MALENSSYSFPSYRKQSCFIFWPYITFTFLSLLITSSSICSSRLIWTISYFHTFRSHPTSKLTPSPRLLARILIPVTKKSAYKSVSSSIYNFISTSLYQALSEPNYTHTSLALPSICQLGLVPLLWYNNSLFY